MSDTKCFYPGCTVDPRTGGAVYRINAYGVPGIWACAKHRANTDARPVPDAVQKLVETINKGAAPAGGSDA